MKNKQETSYMENKDETSVEKQSCVKNIRNTLNGVSACIITQINLHAMTEASIFFFITQVLGHARSWALSPVKLCSFLQT